MLLGGMHDPIAFTGLGLQSGPIQDVQLPSPDFDQPFVAQFASGQGDRFPANAQGVCNFLVGNLKRVPLGLVQGVHDPANDLLFISVFDAADGGHGDLQNHLSCGGHPDFQEPAVLRQFGLEHAQR